MRKKPNTDGRSSFLSYIDIKKMFLLFICRISGGMARQLDIHASVSEQIKKNFYKAKWKVMYRKGFLIFNGVGVGIVIIDIIIRT